MKKTLLYLCILSTQVLFGETAFIAKHHNQVLQHEGNCQIRYSPCCTFNIVLSLMGYEEGLLTDTSDPFYPFLEGYVDHIELWKQPHTPAMWMKHSCVWYSKILTQTLGIQTLQRYVSLFEYGNQDLCGDRGKNNGLTQAWLSSSLEISPEEQLTFLQKFLNRELPLSSYAYEMTKELLYLDTLGDWKLFGKTGSGSKLNAERTEKLDQQVGWFIGWIEREDQTIVFTQLLADEDKQLTYASLRAKALAKGTLRSLISELE